MDETHKLAAIVAPISWIFGLLGWFIFYFALDDNINSAWALSYVLGIVTSLLNLGLMVKASNHLNKPNLNPYAKQSKINILYYIARIVLLVAIFTMVILDQLVFNKTNPKFNIWGTLIGYLLVKIILIVVVVVLKGKVKKE